MRQLADWLEKLGLGRYARRFAENDINFSVLPDMTDQDPKELDSGLSRLRGTRYFLASVALLCAGGPISDSGRRSS
jgi:hypothetical protein